MILKKKSVSWFVNTIKSSHSVRPGKQVNMDDDDNNNNYNIVVNDD